LGIGPAILNRNHRLVCNFGVALPYWAMQTVNRDLPAITTALALLAVPIVGVVCSSIGLGQSIAPTLIFAMALIISGIAIGMIGSL
jgi:drug/metabolite transporter (DMT)-like permease